MSTGTGNAKSGRSAVKWLIIFGLFWSQLALAEHRFEHEFDELVDVCGICLQLESVDSPLTGVAPGYSIPLQMVSADAPDYLLPSIRLFAPYSARASP